MLDSTMVPCRPRSSASLAVILAVTAPGYDLVPDSPDRMRPCKRPQSGTLCQMAARDSNQNFRDSVALSRLVDPQPTLENLARNTGLAYDDVVHHALVRYASSGAEALLAWEPHAVREVIAARKAEDWAKVGAIIDWLEAGLESSEWH
jgi:hypothetical protein